jgi:lipooligosaccharide transport system permease protein
MSATSTIPGSVARVPRFGARHVFERNVLSQRRQWLAVVSGFFEPLFYLLSLTVGVSRLVGPLPGPDGRPISYQAFVAPAMLAASAMNGSITDGSFNFYMKLRHAKVFHAIRATPIGPFDIALAEVASSMARGGAYSLAFIAVMGAMGVLDSWWAVLALPASLLVGLAFAAIAVAATTFVSQWVQLEWVMLLQLPMFLFSGTFYPLSRYPESVRPLVEISPLYHGVALLRGLTTGAVGPGLWWHVLGLLGFGVLGLVVATRRLSRILVD